METSLFIPVRSGSERVINKNTRKFSEWNGGLLQWKLENLVKSTIFDEIIISTNDELSIQIADTYRSKVPGLIIDRRPHNLCCSDTDLTDLIRYVPSITTSEYILWSHVTSPFCNLTHYAEAISKLNNHHSVLGVNLQQEYIWDPHSGKVANACEKNFWPRTQDLKPDYLVNNAIFLAHREKFMEGKRLGENPFLLEFGKISGWDIDTLDDFKIAESIYDRFFK